MPFYDSRKISTGSAFDYDLCIVGAGPAGLALAREFADSRTRIAILESGGREIDDFAYELNQGAVVGLPYPALEFARIRTFGGTSFHWSGNVRPLARIDLEERPGIGRLGWPIAYDDLVPYFERVRPFFGLPDNAFDDDHWSRTNGRPWRFKDDTILSLPYVSLGETARNAGEYWAPTFAKAGNIDVYLHATVVDIRADEAVSSVRAVAVKTPTGKDLTFRARQFVIACGGIENARLLLLANTQQPEGLGNEYGNVGRYFQEHLTNPTFGRFYPTGRHPELGFYRGSTHSWGEAWAALRPSDAALRRERIPNHRFQLAKVVNAFNEDMELPGMQSLQKLVGAQTMFPEEDVLRHVANVIADIDATASALYHRFANHPDYPVRHVDVVQIGEQLPNADSRVYLGDAADAFGQRRAVLDWRVTQADSDGVAGAARLLARALGESGLGRLVDRLTPGGFADRPPHPHYHHMGTTRMHTDPRHGVVDADCRIFRLSNAYVAGSSVFPAGGSANPTFTIAALSIRLADHLKERLAR